MATICVPHGGLKCGVETLRLELPLSLMLSPEVAYASIVCLPGTYGQSGRR